MDYTKKLLEVRDLHKAYSKEGVPTKALNGITFDVLSGEYLGIMGASGSGKTTFSKVLCGLMAPRTGEIRLNGKKMTHRELLKKTYFVMQDADYQLFTESVTHEMELAARKNKQKNVHASKEETTNILDRFGLSEYSRYPCPADKSSGSRLLLPSLQNRIFLFWTSRRVGLTDGICSV